MSAQKKEQEELEASEIPEREELMKKALCLIENYSGSTVSDVAEALKVSEQKAYQALEALKGRGEIELHYERDIYLEVYKLPENED